MRWLAAGARSLRQAGLLAQQQRLFATKAVAEMTWDENLDKLAGLVTTDEGKRELASLKSTFFDIKSKYEDITKPPEPIDWEFYKKEIDPKLVAMFEEAYKTTPLPKYPGTEVEEAKAMFEELQKEAAALTADADRRIKELQAEANLIQDELDKIETISIDEALAADPEAAAEIDKEISEGKWF